MCGTLGFSVFRERDTEQLRAQIDIISQTITAEKEQAAELELKARLYNFGKCKSVEEVCSKLFIIFSQTKMDFLLILPKQKPIKPRPIR